MNATSLALNSSYAKNKFANEPLGNNESSHEIKEKINTNTMMTREASFDGLNEDYKDKSF